MLNRNRSGAALARRGRAVRVQPVYPGEVSESTLRLQREKVELSKPDNFKLTPICEPGW